MNDYLDEKTNLKALYNDIPTTLNKYNYQFKTITSNFSIEVLKNPLLMRVKADASKKMPAIFPSSQSILL